MRFNDKELIKVGEGPVEIEGILHHLKPQGNEWSDWYPQQTFKERTFKLKSNLLFYYRLNESEPLGILVLENYQVFYEKPSKGIPLPFAFSIIFKTNDKLRDNDGKHIFSCRCEADLNKWISALKRASYEHLRSQYIILKTKLIMRTGQDPILNYVRNKEENKKCESTVKTIGAKHSTFYSHIETTSSFYETKTSVTKNVIQSQNVTVGNLIEL